MLCTVFCCIKLMFFVHVAAFVDLRGFASVLRSLCSRGERESYFICASNDNASTAASSSDLQEWHKTCKRGVCVQKRIEFFCEETE